MYANTSLRIDCKLWQGKSCDNLSWNSIKSSHHLFMTCVRSMGFLLLSIPRFIVSSKKSFNLFLKNCNFSQHSYQKQLRNVKKPVIISVGPWPDFLAVTHIAFIIHGEITHQITRYCITFRSSWYEKARGTIFNANICLWRWNNKKSIISNLNGLLMSCQSIQNLVGNVIRCYPQLSWLLKFP